MTETNLVVPLDDEAPVGVDERDNRYVTMSNRLIRAGHSLTLAEKRIVVFAATKLFKKQAPTPGMSPMVKISAAEYAEAFDLDPNTAYEQLKAGGEHLFQRIITFYEPAYSRKDKRLKDTIVRMRWVGRAKYHEGEGWIELAFWHELVPHLMSLKAHFTKYQLEQASALRSVYSWRLLELLMRFESTGWAEYDIEDFAIAMDATEKQRKDFAKLRTKVIEPAVRELREKDGWLIQWQPLKAGRKVKMLRFEFQRDPQGRLF